MLQLARRVCKGGPASLNRFCFSGGHRQAPPTKLQRVEDKIIWLNVKNSYGEYERVAAFQGESLTQALVRSRVNGIAGECMGRGQQVPLHSRPQDPYSYGPGCKTCMVAIREPWKSQLLKELGKVDFEEKSMILTGSQEDADARLGCYIPIEEWMSEMNVTVVENIDDDV